MIVFPKEDSERRGCWKSASFEISCSSPYRTIAVSARTAATIALLRF